MPKLRDHPEDLAALTIRTAEAVGIDEAFVEKDFWVVEVLRAAAVPRQIAAKDGVTHDVLPIFKGGTSLSRVFRLIERFSEDVDLLVPFPDAGLSINARDKVLKQIRDDVSAHLARDGEPVASTTGVKRNIRYPYPTRFGSAAVTEGVLLEMGSRGGTYPTEPHQLRSMLANFAIEQLSESPEAWEEFAPVTVEVLSPERTLLEKLALLHDAVSRYPEDGSRAKLLTGGRHLYDVHQLLDSEPVVRALTSLGSDGVDALCADIDRHSEHADFTFTPRPASGFGASPLCDNSHAARAVLREGYERALSLVYGTRPGFEECVDSIRLNSAIL